MIMIECFSLYFFLYDFAGDLTRPFYWFIQGFFNSEVFFSYGFDLLALISSPPPVPLRLDFCYLPSVSSFYSFLSL